MLIDRLDKAHDSARKIVLDALDPSCDNDEAVLLRWMAETNVNPYEVFPLDGGAFSSYEGLAGLLLSLGHAFRDDGEASFIICKGANPIIVFADAREPGFNEFLLERMKGVGHGDNVVHVFTPVNTVKSVKEYISAFEEHDKAQKELWAKYGF